MERVAHGMKTTLPNIYGYYVNGELLHTGTSAELGEKLGCSSRYITELCRHPISKHEVKLLYKQYHEFEVYDKNGTVLFQGTSKECADFMCVTMQGFWLAVIYTRQGKRTGRRGGLLARKKGVCLR